MNATETNQTRDETLQDDLDLSQRFMTPSYAFLAETDYKANLRDGSRIMPPLLGANLDNVRFASNP